MEFVMHHLLVCQPEACSHLPHGFPGQGRPPSGMGGRGGVAGVEAKLRSGYASLYIHHR